MPRPRFQKLPVEKREHILTAVGRGFAEHGYDGATMSMILEHAGISTGAAYYYFEDKADLYATVVREAWQQLSPQGHVDLQSLDRTSFWPALEAFHLAGFERSRQQPWLVTVWKLASDPPPAGVAASAVAEVFEGGRAS